MWLQIDGTQLIALKLTKIKANNSIEHLKSNT